MAETKLDIWNAALDRIGEPDEIQDEGEKRVAADVCRRRYTRCVREALAFGGFPWSFAGGQKAVAELPDQKRVGWEHAYDYPANCLLPRALVTEGGTRLELTLPSGRLKYALQANASGDGLILLTDHGPDEFDALEYTRNDISEVLFPPHFESAVAYRLAAELALAVVKGPEGRALHDRIMHPVAGDFLVALQRAASDDLSARPSSTPTEVEGEYLTSRK